MLNLYNIDGRIRVQNSVINSSLVYDRKKGAYRTDGLNCFLRFNIDTSRVSEMGKNENSQLLTGNSSLVDLTTLSSNYFKQDLLLILR